MSDDDTDRSQRDRLTRFADYSRERSMDRGNYRGGLKSSLCRVYVSNIPYEYRWQDLKGLFRSQVGDVSFVELFVDANENPRGCGIVEFSDSNSVKKCLEVMHRFELKGRKLIINQDFGNSRDKYGNLDGFSANKRARDREDTRDRYRDVHRSGGGGYVRQNNWSLHDGTKWDNTYGLNPQFLQSLGINVPLNNQVSIANLDYKVDKKKLKEIFRLAGKVQRIELSSDYDGKSRGFAVLEYDHPVEAVQSISMLHNQILYDRAMIVRMNRKGDRGISKLPEGLKGIGMGLDSNGEPLRDVSRKLSSPSSAGILGAIPNMALNNASVLQAANLGCIGGLSGNLFESRLGNGDFSLATASLVNYPLMQSQQLLGNSGGLSSNNLGNSKFSRNDGVYGGGNSGGGDYQNNSGYQNSDAFGYTSDRDSLGNNGSNIYSTVNNGSQMLLNSNLNLFNANKGSEYSNKILITNLPQTSCLKMLTEKCSEYGDVQRIEDKGNNGILVVFSSEREAGKAIKNMHHARIDGRTIDVRLFY